MPCGTALMMRRGSTVIGALGALCFDDIFAGPAYSSAALTSTPGHLFSFKFLKGEVPGPIPRARRASPPGRTCVLNPSLLDSR